MFWSGVGHQVISHGSLSLSSDLMTQLLQVTANAAILPYGAQHIHGGTRACRLSRNSEACMHKIRFFWYCSVSQGYTGSASRAEFLRAAIAHIIEQFVQSISPVKNRTA
jgi:hypothetical protein